MAEFEADLALARALQAQFDEEDAHEEVSNLIPEEFRFASPAKRRKVDPASESSIIAPEWEDLDPTPGLKIKNYYLFNSHFGIKKIFLGQKVTKVTLSFYFDWYNT